MKEKTFIQKLSEKDYLGKKDLYVLGYKKPILIRVSDFIDLTREFENSFMLSMLKSGLTDNLIDKIPIIKGKNINDVFIKFHNNEQTKSTIELLQTKHYLLTNKKSVKIPKI